jgi:hypothetical protein
VIALLKVIPVRELGTALNSFCSFCLQEAKREMQNNM